MKDNFNIFPLRVYTFIDNEGHHYGYELVNSNKELAEKLVANHLNKLVTDLMDLPVLNTFGSFVNQVFNNEEHFGPGAPNYKPWFFNEFQSILLEAQRFFPEDDLEEYISEEELYAQMCAGCVNDKRCHKECTHCQEFLEALEGGEDDA